MREQDALNLLFRVGRAMEQLHREQVPTPVMDRIAEDMMAIGAVTDDACPRRSTEEPETCAD